MSDRRSSAEPVAAPLIDVRDQRITKNSGIAIIGNRPTVFQIKVGPWSLSRPLLARVLVYMLCLASIIVASNYMVARPVRGELAVDLNNRAALALQQNDLKLGQQYLSSANWFDPDQVVVYMNLADLAYRSGELEQAVTWYKRAKLADPNFTPAYRSLGHIYNLQHHFDDAERTLIAGLRLLPPEDQSPLALVTRYGLLAELGRAYVAQNLIDEALEQLETAVALEYQIRQLEEAASQRLNRPITYRSAMPSFYLAQVYETLQRPQEASCAWQQSLRFLDKHDWHDRELLAIVHTHSQQLPRCAQ